CFICAREAVKRMSTKHGGKGGAIVNVSSGSANLGNPGIGVLYAASKGAVNSFGIGLSQEVAAEGVRVNTVAPGMTRTDMPGADRIATQAAKIPMGRVAEPEEIAEAIYWLLSDRAGYIAGANIRVGGGRL
ncbi:MAG: SDR family oxidoreductase, partial [Proteobacteria bacterium]|nr:SDR family oxidoreductase [Pseudomonadota bacterium]